MELDCRSICRKTGVSPEMEMDVVTGVELEYSYVAGGGQTRSGVVSVPKERSGGPRLDQSCNWEKYGYDTSAPNKSPLQLPSTGLHCAAWTALREDDFCECGLLEMA